MQTTPGSSWETTAQQVSVQEGFRKAQSEGVRVSLPQHSEEPLLWPRASLLTDGSKQAEAAEESKEHLTLSQELGDACQQPCRRGPRAQASQVPL